MLSQLLHNFKKARQKTSLAENELYILQPIVAKGNYASEEDIVIDSTFSGNVASDGHITIGPNAIFNGNVSSRVTHIQGAMSGKVSAKDTAVVQGGSKLNQVTIVAEKVDIQTGSTLKDVRITTK